MEMHELEARLKELEGTVRQLEGTVGELRSRVQVTEDVSEIKEVQYVPERPHGHRVGRVRRAASRRTPWWTSTCTTR